LQDGFHTRNLSGVPSQPARPSKKSKQESPGETAPDAESQLATAPEVFRKLRELIINGQLPPGAPVTERKVADRLKVSRTPVRSALHRLQQEGFLTSVGSAAERRLIVAPMTQGDGGELYTMVGHLEALAARRAAQLPTAERKALAAQMRDVNRDLAAALREGVYVSKVFELDLQFHQLFVDRAAGPRLRRLHRSIKLQIERYARAYIGVLVDALRDSVAEHDVIIRCIATGEPKAAQDAVETNWYHATDRLLGTIERYGERGTWHIVPAASESNGRPPANRR
jgi:DNA-binding GntR family transcriptional regulator